MNTFDHFFPRLQGKLGTIVSFIAEVYLGIVNPGDRFKSKVMYFQTKQKNKWSGEIN